MGCEDSVREDSHPTILYTANTMKLLTIAEGLGIAAIFTVSMLLIVALRTRTERSLEGFFGC